MSKKGFDVLHPEKDQRRIHHIQISSSGCLYPVWHEPFGPEYPVVNDILPQRHTGSLAGAFQFSYTVALVLTGWTIKDRILHCTWQLLVSPSNPGVELALNLSGTSGTMVQQFGKLAELCSSLPLMKGTCFAVKIGHCGGKPPVMEPWVDFLHGVEKIQERLLAEVPWYFRWLYDKRILRGFMIPPNDLWLEDAAIQRKLEIVLENLKTLARSTVVRVEGFSCIQEKMEKARVGFSPGSGETVVLVGKGEEGRAARHRTRRGGNAGFTIFTPSNEVKIPPTPPPFSPTRGTITVTISSPGKPGPKK